MRLTIAALALAIGSVPALAAEQGILSLGPLVADGRTVGAAMLDGGAPVAELRLGIGGGWSARTVTPAEGAIELRDFDTSGTGGTPMLGPGSYVRLACRPGEPFPELTFRFEITGFERAAWEKALGKPAPLTLLSLPLADARLWYVHGLLCPTPALDPYPMTRPSIRGQWDPAWSYGAALGALTVPAMALWNEQSGTAVGLEWAEARLTDKSDKDLGLAYCAGLTEGGAQFLALLSNAQADWTSLTDPTLPLTVESHLRVLYSRSLIATDDLNRLVFESIYSSYPSLLPRVPGMNDLGWMVDRGLEDLGRVGPSGGGFLSSVESGGWGWNQMFYDPGAVLYWGAFRPVDRMYRLGDAEAIARFEADLATYLSHVQWREEGGERCCAFRYPLEGSWNRGMGGEAAATIYNVQQFGVGAAMLASYANTKRPELLPYLDGTYAWARHYAFTRGDIADIPESMFTLQTTSLAMDFLMNYRGLFASDPDPGRRARAAAALELARSVVWRNANVTVGDADERDTLSAGFMMPGNMNKWWVGQISNAELCAPFASLIVLHVETGDPVAKWLVRGALERWWIGYEEDCWHTAENIDVWGVATGTKGLHTGIHGPCDDFREWSQPVGDALLRVTCGAKAAIAFCRDTRALDVADYAFREPGSIRFRIAGRSTGAPTDRFAVIVSSPFRDLSGMPVRINGQAVPEADTRILGTYREHVYIRGVRVGDLVEIGEAGAPAPLALPEVPTVGEDARTLPQALTSVGGRRFELLSLRAEANAAPSRSFRDPESLGGLPSGLSYAHSVPYFIPEDLSDGAKWALGPGARARLDGREAFVLVRFAEGGSMRIGDRSLTAGDGLVAAEGWPLCKWRLRLLPLTLPQGGAELAVGEGATVLAATVLREGPALADGLRARVASLTSTDAAQSRERIVAEAKARLEAGGGARRAPIAFVPPHGDTLPVLQAAATQLGLTAYALTPRELIDPAVFTPGRFPVAVYTGDETYLRSVKERGDAERALLGFLERGGLLLVAGKCRPFTYPLDLAPDGTAPVPAAPWELLGKRFELFLLGPGEKTADAIGFEAPPAGVTLALRNLDGNEELWATDPETPFPAQGDRRFRPMSAVGVPAGDEVTPLLRVTGSDGKSYGMAMGLVAHRCASYRGAKVLFVWGSLLAPTFPDSETLAVEALTCAVREARAATEPLPPDLSGELPAGDFRVAVLPPDCWRREEMIRRACEAVGATPAFLSPDQFVNPAYFNATNFPVAIQAPEDERFVLTVRAPGDGEAAYKRFLAQGGTLIVCQPATPFAYEAIREGDGWRKRAPQRFWSMSFDLGFETEYGFEKPEATMGLALTEAGAALWPSLPAVTPLDALRDERWRSIVPYRSSAARTFVPLAYATKPDGEPYRGLAAARVDFLESRYAGAREFVLWGNMVDGPLGETLLAGCLRSAREDPPPAGTMRPAP